MKDISRSLCYPVYVVIVFHLVKQSAKPLGFLFKIVSIIGNSPATRVRERRLQYTRTEILSSLSIVTYIVADSLHRLDRHNSQVFALSLH